MIFLYHILIVFVVTVRVRVFRRLIICWSITFIDIYNIHIIGKMLGLFV